MAYCSFCENFQNSGRTSDWQEAVAENQGLRKEQRKNAKPAKSAKKRDEAVAADATSALLEESAEESGTGEKVKKIGLTGQQAVEAVMPGVSFGFEVSVSGTKAQCGMILAAISDLFQPGRALGGFVRNGYGRFAANLNVRIDGQTMPFLRSDGRDLMEIADGSAKDFINVFESDLKHYTTEQFRGAYLLLQSKDKEA